MCESIKRLAGVERLESPIGPRNCQLTASVDGFGELFLLLLSVRPNN